MIQKLKYFPVTAFSVVMGIAGFTIVLLKFYYLQWLPSIYSAIFLWLTVFLFLLISVIYGLKYIYFPNKVKTDFLHRIRINFFSTISISILLLSIIFQSYYPLLSIPLWWIGTILHTIFLFKTITFWIQHSFEIQHFNPLWFIPVVGNVIIPIAGVEFVSPLINYFYFSAGFFFWFVLFTIFLYRAIFHPQLPEKFEPTFFILMAPPAIGFISYMRINLSWDFYSIFLLTINYFFIAMLVAIIKSFSQLKFNMSGWAFTFPLAATTLSSTVAFQVHFRQRIISFFIFQTLFLTSLLL